MQKQIKKFYVYDKENGQRVSPDYYRATEAAKDAIKRNEKIGNDRKYSVNVKAGDRP